MPRKAKLTREEANARLAEGREKVVKRAKKYADKSEYLRAYREQKGDEIASKRKTRYDTDPEYRAACIERAKRSYAKRRAELDKLRRGGLLPPPRRKKTAGTENLAHTVCPLCRRPFPQKPKPVFMLISKRYQVTMFPLREVAYRLGKNARTIAGWISDKVMPDSQYKSKGGHRLWTQDQIELLMKVCSRYDLRPPVSFVKCGFVAELRAEWEKLRATKGINPALYTVTSEHGLLKRKSDALPPPITAAEGKVNASFKEACSAA